MITMSVAFGLSLLLSAILTPVVRDLALRKGWLDQASSSRKVHTTPIPRLGGVAIVLAFFAPLAGLLVVTSGAGQTFVSDIRIPTGIFVGGLMISALGILDDFRGLGAGKKFSIQFLVAAMMFQLGFQIDQISTPWGAIDLGAFSLPFTMVWIVGVINAMNLIDGLDGLASGVAFVAVATNFLIAAHGGNVLMMLFMAALAGAILGFLLYNFNPASIFMGDTGSMFLGFILSTSSIVTNTKSTATVAMLVPVLALGLPIMDTFLAMGRRALRGRPLFAADKEHLHHRLLALGLSHRAAVMVLYGVGVCFAALALLLTYANGPQTALILGVTAVVAVVFVRKLGYFSLLAEDSRAVRERNLAVREQVRAIGESLQGSALPSHAWEAIQPIGRAMGMAELSLTLISLSQTGAKETSRFDWKIDLPQGERMELRLPLESAGAQLGVLEVAWNDGRRSIERDDEIALELLRDHLASTAKRISAQVPANVVALRRKA